MNEERNEIIDIVKKAMWHNSTSKSDSIVLDCNDVDHAAEECAEEIINAGYINGEDFVEWLKDNWNIVARDIVIESLTKALQEYMKGE